MELGLYRSGCLRREHLYASSDKGGKDGNGEEHDAETAYPLYQRAPEQNAVRQDADIVNDGGAGGGKSGHCLEEGVRERGQIASNDEGHRSHKGEHHPRERHDKVSVAT